MLANMMQTIEETPSILPSVLVVCFGCLISILGLFRALKGKSSSSFSFCFGKMSIKMTKLTQGAIITIIGAIISVAGLYAMPVKKTAIKSTTTTIIDPNGKITHTAD